MMVYCSTCSAASSGERLLWAIVELSSRLNHILKDCPLVCAYPITGFDNDQHIEPFLKMCAAHSGVIPSESWGPPSTMEERLRTIADLQQRTRALEHALELRQSEERFRLLVEAVQDYA